MDVEKVGEVYTYQLNYPEFVVIYGLFKYLDEKRRQGGSTDTVPLHSAIRPVYTMESPHDDEARLVRWVYDVSEAIGNSRQALPAPSLTNLITLTEDALDTYDDPSAHYLLHRSIGRMVLERPEDKPACSTTTYRSETLWQLNGNLRKLHTILSGWHNHLASN